MNYKDVVEGNPSIDDLKYVIRWCNADLKNKAGEVLKTKVRAKEIDEQLLIEEIAEIVLARPDKLQMDEWHCGTSHCLAGWACKISQEAKRIESLYGTQIAGYVALPNYGHLFFKENDTVMEVLKQVKTNKQTDVNQPIQ